jgi:hypothetical protein
MLICFCKIPLAPDPADLWIAPRKTKTMKNIEAETARLAGLHIDLNQKLRSGNMTLDQFEWWLNQPKNTREALMTGEKPSEKTARATESTEKFGLLVDLGIITVPDDYVHESRLAKFDKENRKKFYCYNEAITDKNYPNPTRILKPGDQLRVRAFKQSASGTTTSEERMAFLETQKAVHTGAQGASLVFEQKRDQLPKGKWYASFDEKDCLWKDADGNHRVPDVDCSSDGIFGFDLGYFGSVWDDDDAFLCFCDIQ